MNSFSCYRMEHIF